MSLDALPWTVDSLCGPALATAKPIPKGPGLTSAVRRWWLEPPSWIAFFGAWTCRWLWIYRLLWVECFSVSKRLWQCPVKCHTHMHWSKENVFDSHHPHAMRWGLGRPRKARHLILWSHRSTWDEFDARHRKRIISIQECLAIGLPYGRDFTNSGSWQAPLLLFSCMAKAWNLWSQIAWASKQAAKDCGNFSLQLRRFSVYGLRNAPPSLIPYLKMSKEIFLNRLQVLTHHRHCEFFQEGSRGRHGNVMVPGSRKTCKQQAHRRDTPI